LSHAPSQCIYFKSKLARTILFSPQRYCYRALLELQDGMLTGMLRERGQTSLGSAR
jgi:hypothetical protein